MNTDIPRVKYLNKYVQLLIIQIFQNFYIAFGGVFSNKVIFMTNNNIIKSFSFSHIII